MNLPFECPVCGHKTNLHQTNADRIRAMTDEELAEFLCSVDDDYTSGEGGKFIEGTIIIDYDEDAILEWLQRPAEGD